MRRRGGGYDYGARSRPVYNYPPFLPRIEPRPADGPVPFIPRPVDIPAHIEILWRPGFEFGIIPYDTVIGAGGASSGNPTSYALSAASVTDAAASGSTVGAVTGSGSDADVHASTFTLSGATLADNVVSGSAVGTVAAVGGGGVPASFALPASSVTDAAASGAVVGTVSGSGSDAEAHASTFSLTGATVASGASGATVGAVTGSGGGGGGVTVLADLSAPDILNPEFSKIADPQGILDVDGATLVLVGPIVPGSAAVAVVRASGGGRNATQSFGVRFTAPVVVVPPPVVTPPVSSAVPTTFALSGSTVADNASSGTSIGTVTGTGTDPDAHATSFSLSASTTADNASSGATVGTVSGAGGAAPVGATVTGFVCIGDSITRGAGSTNPALYSYPAQLAALTGLPVTNLGADGDFILANDSEWGSPTAYGGDPAAAYNPTTANTLLIEGGGADIRDRASTYVQYAAALQSIATKARAAGYAKVIVSTVLPLITNPDRDPGIELYRQQYITWLKANWASFADGLADFTVIPQLTDPANTTYFADGIHPTNAGYAFVAEAFRAASGAPHI